MTEPDDAELWQRMRADDADAFGLLFQRHADRIHRYALRRTADPDTAEDVTAVVFLEAWRRRDSVELLQPSALPWLYGVAGNVVNRWRRSRRRHEGALQRMAGLPPRTPELVEVQAEAAAASATVLDQISRLPKRDREVLVLSAWEGLSQAEIAVALDITVGAVKSRLTRARARLDRDPPAPAPTPTTAIATSPTTPPHSLPTVTTVAPFVLEEI